jgi:hypothetical protein
MRLISVRFVTYQRIVWVCLSVYPPIVAKQRLEAHVPVATKNWRLPVQSMSYQRT